jgi:hypothetical protein
LARAQARRHSPLPEHQNQDESYTPGHALVSSIGLEHLRKPDTLSKLK